MTDFDAPDFAELFDGSDEDNALTPRTASWLFTSAQVLADNAFDDVLRHGDAPVTDDANDWYYFDELPRITWRRDALWRRQMARSFDDLAADITEGRAPLPRCTAEEFALHGMILRSRDLLADGDDYLVDSVADLPQDHTDGDWDSLLTVLFQDHDFLLLHAPDVDGIEDPDVMSNQLLGIGDLLRPANWFRTFDNAVTRQAGRPFRR